MCLGIIPDFPEFVRTNNFYDRRGSFSFSFSSSPSSSAFVSACALRFLSVIEMVLCTARMMKMVGHVIISFQSNRRYKNKQQLTTKEIEEYTEKSPQRTERNQNKFKRNKMLMRVHLAYTSVEWKGIIYIRYMK